MTESEYFDKIQSIRRHTAGGRLETAELLLKEMYAYKPVRLLWFVAKAEYVLEKDDDPEAALKVLDGKYFLCEDYAGLKECMKFRMKAYKRLGREWDADREDYCYQKARGKSCARQENALADALEAFAADSGNLEALQELGRRFYQTADIAASFIVYSELSRLGCPQDVKNEIAHRIANYGYLDEKINENTSSTFILVMDEYLNRTLEVLGHILHRAGHKVFLLSPPVLFETGTQLDLRDTLEISMEQIQQYPDMCIIPPVALAQEGIIYGDNREYIIDHICREESRRDHGLVFCSGGLLEDLCTRNGTRGRIGRLSPYETDFLEEKLQFGWAGSYLSYISDLYGYDVRPGLEAEPEVDFSIVIPARNSADTLRYTLQTCLRQRYAGTYEVIVSDNSVDDDPSVYELCCEIGDPRIRYIKTPRLLQLTKSFEFAYLKTRGEFILSIGSDDGVLPWGLDALRRILEQFPTEDIVQWDRGFYAWPGFNGGQENMFCIPCKYGKEIHCQYVDTGRMLSRVAQDPQAIYNMPLLYINSGFRRRYMKTLLEKTGRLWDGCNQDLQTGIINCCIYSRFLRVAFPITIAGMSSSSIGYLGNTAHTSLSPERAVQAEKRLYQQDNFGVYVPLARERRILLTGADACGIYLTVSRAVEMGLLSEENADNVLSWRDAMIRIFESFSIEWENYDRLVHIERFMASNGALMLRDWFDQEIYHNVLLPRYTALRIPEQERTRKLYQETADSYGREILDASRYGVCDIAGAVALFERRTGL